MTFISAMCICLPYCLFQDVQQKVRPYLLGIDMAHFKYDDFIKVLGIVKR